MNENTLATIKGRLQGLARRLDGDTRNLIEEGLSPQASGQGGQTSNAPFHLADGGTEEFLSMMNATLLENEAQLAADVRDALQRLEEGVYGRCEACQKEIAEERLLALPYARNCIRCATLAEKEGRVPVANVNHGRPRGPRDTLAPEGEMQETRRGDASENDRSSLPFAHDEHAVGTPGGGSASGGLAGTNIGHGDPTLGDLADESGSGEWDHKEDR